MHRKKVNYKKEKKNLKQNSEWKHKKYVQQHQQRNQIKYSINNYQVKIKFIVSHEI